MKIGSLNGQIEFHEMIKCRFKPNNNFICPSLHIVLRCGWFYRWARLLGVWRRIGRMYCGTGTALHHALCSDELPAHWPPRTSRHAVSPSSVLVPALQTRPHTATTSLWTSAFRRHHKKWEGPWTKYKQNANLGNSYCSYKNPHQANTVVSQYLNRPTYRTDWNMTHKQTNTCRI